MSERAVWVVEGRSLRRNGKWRVQQAYWNRSRAWENLRVYRDGRNPKDEFRVKKYVPAPEEA